MKDEETKKREKTGKPKKTGGIKAIAFPKRKSPG
jgi:hypothetical protein